MTDHDTRRAIALTPNLEFPVRVERTIFGAHVEQMNAEVYRVKDGTRERMQYEDSTRFGADGICAYVPTEWGAGTYVVQFYQRGSNDVVRRFTVRVEHDAADPQNVRATLTTGA